MKKQDKELKIQLFKILHVFITVCAFVLCWMLFRYHSIKVEQRIGYRYNYYIAVGFFAIYQFFARTYNAYLLGFSRIRNLASAQFVSQLFSTVILYFIVFLGWNKWRSPFWFFVFLGFCAVIDCFWSYWANGLYYRLNPTKKAIMLYSNKTALARLGSISGKPTERLYRVDKQVCCEGKSYFEIMSEVRGYDAIIVSGLDSRIRNGISKYCLENSVDGFFLPHIGDVILQGAEHG